MDYHLLRFILCFNHVYMCVSVYGYVEIREHGLEGQERRSGHETIALSISPDSVFPLKGRDNSLLSFESYHPE